MDCEKYEPLLLDELYEELDELTSAALKRHVSGCARCAEALHAMRATRRLVALPMVPVPAGLEDRILGAAREAQKVVPIQSRLSRAVSWAGNWAMRPQTAMAAVFLLMIGSSAFLLRSNKSSADAPVSVTVAGEPAPAQVAAASPAGTLDNSAAAAAHGANTPMPTTLPPLAAASASAVAMNDDLGPMAKVAPGAMNDKKSGALGSALTEKEDEAQAGKDRAAPAKLARKEEDGVATRDIANAAAPAGAPYAQYPGGASGAGGSAAPENRATKGEDPFAQGMAAYRARNFEGAKRSFDAAAAAGTDANAINAALWAAKSVRDGSGCAPALGRFESVAQKAAGTYAGNEAELEAARCQVALGQLDAARDRLNRLTKVASHAAQAQQALGDLNQVAARRAGGPSGARAAPAAPAAAPKSPAPAPAKPTTTDGY